MSDSFCYAIRRPGGKRRTFAIQKQVLPNGSRTTISSEQVDAINTQFLAGTISFDEALRKIESVRNSLYKERDKHTPRRDLFYAPNEKVLERYWNEEYSDRDILHRQDRLSDLRRAVRALGSVSLISASKAELTAALDAAFATDPNKQRRAVARLNQILKFLGRPFTLRKKREVVEPLRFLTLEHLDKVLAQLRHDPPLQLAVRTAFATGCRAGELFAIRPAHIRNDGTVYIASQLTGELDERETKTRKKRRVWVLPEGRGWLKEWAEIPMTVREELRTRKHSTMLRAACKRAEVPECRFHDLRHSYAVHCLSVLGAPIQLVAQSLGNSVSVCEKYYSGFILTDPGIEFLERLAYKKSS